MGPAAIQFLELLKTHGGKIGAAAENLKNFNAYFEGTKALAGEAIGVLKKLGDKWVEIEDISFKAARTMAMSREQALEYNKQLIIATRELASQYGVTAKELADFQKSYAEAVGRNVVLTREQLAHMSALAKITDNATAQKLVDEFDKVGVGIARATAYTGRLQERAKALGVSPAKATKMMADNIKLAASYSFRNGVNDIEKMSLKAASMRMDMQSIMNATDRFSNIESAITNSANIQMLGGSFAREFSNPMGVMFESMADPAAFQDRILRTIEGKGKYDSKTGAVTFDPVTMRMMKEMASQLGMSAQELNTSAMASVQNAKVEEELKAKGAYDKWADNPAMLDAIKNLSRTNVDENGEHFVTVLEDGEEKQVKISELTEEQIRIATDNQLTQEGLWSDVQDIKTILERVHGRARETKSMKEGAEGIKSWWDAAVARIQNWFMPTVSNIFNGFTNFLGNKYAEGGIVKPIAHAAMGTIIPGDSYMGDHTPVMANSGEMILNPMQQKSMFNLISSLTLTGGMTYGMNKVGGKLGYGGIGSTMLLANMLGGGETDLKSLIEAHLIKKAIKQINPLKTSIAEVGTVAENATKSTSAFKTHWGEFTEQLSKDWGTLTGNLSDKWHKFSRRVSVISRRYFTTGRWGKITSAASDAAGVVGRNTMAAGRWTASTAKTIGEWIGKYTINPISGAISKGWNWAKGTKLGLATQDKIGAAQLKLLRAKFGYRDLVKPKAQEYSKLIRNLFNDGSKAQASKAASRAISNAAIKEASTVSNAGLTAKGGKLLSNIGKVGKSLAPAAKFISKKLPVIGNVLAVGGALSDMSSASSQYDAKIDEIERSGMSDLDKAKAKDRAAKEKNASYGSSIGSAAGTAIGGALGSALGPLGTIAGMWLGEKAGSFLGKGIGGLFGGSEEEKFKEEQKERISKYEDAVKILTSIDNKLSVISGKSIGIKGKTLASPSLPKLDIKQGIGTIAGAALGSAFGPLGMLAGGMLGSHISSKVDALPISGNFMKVEPTKGSDTTSNAISTVGSTSINLNVSGTIKLEGGGKSVDFDLSKLIDTPEFKRQLADIVTRRINEDSNSGKRNMESERNNMASQYNKSGK